MEKQNKCKKRNNSELCEDEMVKKQKVEENTKSHDCLPAKTGKEVDNHTFEVHPHRSPKKRLEITTHVNDNKRSDGKKPKEKFIYGNYSKYYGYRNKNQDFHDIRLDVFETQAMLFQGKAILDIGCNSGFITLEIAKRFKVQHITGIDIDRSLINQVNKYTTKLKKTSTGEKSRNEFPFNVSFIHANYVLRDDVLLEIERPQFDVILCLSVTKWIQLNFGDAGLKQVFRRMFLQLQAGGKLILEAQPFDNYGRRKKITVSTNISNLVRSPLNISCSEHYLEKFLRYCFRIQFNVVVPYAYFLLIFKP